MPESRASLLRVIGKLLHNIHHSPTLSDALEGILGGAVELLRADRGEFAVFDVKTRRLKLAAVVGRPTGTSRIRGADCPSNGFMQSVWEQEQCTPRIVGDVEPLKKKASGYYESDRKTKSEAAVRIEFSGQPRGVLNVESYRSDAFSKADGIVLQQLGEYAAIAVEMDMERRVRGLVAELLAEKPTQSLAVVLQEIFEVVHELFGFDRGLIFMADDKRKRLECCGWYGVAHRPFSFGYKERAAATWVREHGKGEFWKRTDKDPRKIVNKRGKRAFGVSGSLIGVPLRFGEQVVGVLMSWSSDDPHPTEGDLMRLAPLATLAAWKIGVLQVEKTLKEGLEFRQSLIEHLNAWVFCKDLRSRFTFANEFFVQHIGQKKPEDVIGKRDSDFFTKDCAKRYREGDAQVFKSGTTLHIQDERHQVKGEDAIMVDGYKVPIRNAEGAVIGLQCVFWDVTRHAAARACSARGLNSVVDRLAKIAEQLEGIRGEDAKPANASTSTKAPASKNGNEIGFTPNLHAILWLINSPPGDHPFENRKAVVKEFIKQLDADDCISVNGRVRRITHKANGPIFGDIAKLFRAHCLTEDDTITLTHEGKKMLEKWSQLA